MKIRINKIGLLFLSVLFLILQGNIVSAKIVFNESNDGGDWVFRTGLTIQQENFIGGNHLNCSNDWGASELYAVSGNCIYWGHYAGIATPMLPFPDDQSGGYFCESDPRIAGFCADIAKTCHSQGETDYRSTCDVAIAQVWDEKMKTILQKEIDDLMTTAGVDNGKAATIVETCKGDKVCIDKLLISLRTNSDYMIKEGESACDMAAGGLTLAQISSCGSNSDPNVTIPEGDLGAMNSADKQGSATNKQSGPQVAVDFSAKPSFKEGATVTATAVPGFFNNNSDPKNLYFTWYLKRENCESTMYIDKNKNNKKTYYKKIPFTKEEREAPGFALKHDIAKCDLNDDEEIDEEDWKIAAAQIMVRGEFDQTKANYVKADYNTTEELISGFKATPNPVNQWDQESVDVTNCYVKEEKSGVFLEIRESESTFKDSCPSGYVRACTKELPVVPAPACNVVNSAYSEFDAAHTSPSGSYLITKGIDQLIGNPCAVTWTSSEETEKKESKRQKCVKDTESTSNFATKVKCGEDGDNEYPVCVLDNSNNLFPKDASETSPAEEIIFGKKANTVDGKTTYAFMDTASVCELLFKPNTDVSAGAPKFLNEKNAIFADIENKGCAETIAKMEDNSVGGNAMLNPKCSFIKSKNFCKHLFPKKTGFITGDGKMTLAEKKAWGINPDPNVISTNGSGKKDEEVLTGLGMDKFKWMYTPGDQVGVAIEGDSALASEHPDSSYKRMWALSKNTCSYLKEISKDPNIEQGFYQEGVGTAARGFLTTEFDINRCLEENLLDPTENDAASLKVELTSSPANPINDKKGNGDILKVVASAANTENAEALDYEWSVEKSNTIPSNSTIWKNITDEIKTTNPTVEKSFSEKDLKGLGKNSLDINLNIEDSVLGDVGSFFYLKIKVTTTGSLVDGNKKSRGAITIRVRQQQNKIEAYPIKAATDGKLSLMLKDNEGDSLRYCENSAEPCYVAKNEIVGVTVPVPEKPENEVSSFAWTINGEKITCNSDISDQCKPSTSAGAENSLFGKTLFFPILGEIGESVKIVAKGLNARGELIEISKDFVITGNEFQIMSWGEEPSCNEKCLDDSNVCPKYLGKYKVLTKDDSSLEYQDQNDCASEVWQTNSGRTVKFAVQSSQASGLIWTVDGQIMDEETDTDDDTLEISDNKLVMKVIKKEGEAYSIGVSSHLTPEDIDQINNERKALFKNWGITQEDVIEEDQNVSIQLEVVAGAEIVSKSPSIFSASLITHLPEQLMFLLKISLTSMLLLAATRALFAFMPEKLFQEEN